MEGDWPPAPEAMDPNQMHPMQALMSMTGGMPPPSMTDLGGMPAIDPSVMQAYMMYFQAGLQQPGFGATMPGFPPMPFPGIPYMAPPAASEQAIRVSVEGMKFQYQLTEDDLGKVFSRYGKVKHIRVDDAGSSALLAFHNQQDAQAAMNDLNGKVLNGLEGTLRITWSTMPVPATATPSPYMPPYPSIPFPAPWAGAPALPVAPWPSGADVVGTPVPPLASHSTSATAAAAREGAGGTSGKGVRKYTCRFLIGIENDEDFQVARRIIGAKGINMKRIFKQTDAKLRLRGKGSGYVEGSGQKESSEPLQLCISSTSEEGYKSAVKQVEELLVRLYDDYRTYCKENGRQAENLQINFSENQLVYSRMSQASPATTSVSGSKSPEKTEVGKDEKKRGRGGRRREAKGEILSGDGVDRGLPGPNAPTAEEIEKFIDDRNEARRACNFAEADRIREMLIARGVAVMDEPGGRGRGAEVTTWRYWRD